MNRTKKTMKLLLVFALTFVLLANALMPIAVKGSDRDISSEYQYYSVKAGDTLTRIAKNNGVTVSDIMTANSLSNADRIYTGQVLKVPVSSSSAAHNGLSSSRLSMNLKDANVKDVISAIALNAGYTVVIEKSAEGNEQTVSVNLEQMSPLKAIDAVTRLVGLTYLKDGNTIMIGTPSGLNSTFVDKTVLSKITFDYITVDAFQSQMSALGLGDVQMVATNNQDEFYISGYPKEIAKMNELKKILDVSSNIMPGGNLIPSHLTAIELTHIDASEFNGFLGELGLSQGLVLGSRPYTLYVYVTGANLADIKTIQKIVDKPLTGMNLEAGGNKEETPKEPNTPAEPNTPVIPNPNPIVPTPTPNPSEPVVPQEPAKPEETVMQQVDLTEINRKEAVSILNSFSLPVQVFGPEKCTKTLWISGTQAQVQDAVAKLQSFDTPEYATQALRGDMTFFYHELHNCTAEEIQERMENFQLEGVTLRPNGTSSITKSLVVYCPEMMAEEVKSLLDEMDQVNVVATRTNYVVESNTDADLAKARMDVLKQLYPELNDTTVYEFTYNTIPAKDGTESVVTYVKTTAEGVKYVRALLAEMNSAA